MDVRVDTMPVTQTSKKRKALFSSPAVRASAAPASPSPSADSVNLSAALTALKVSLKRDFGDCFAPPTTPVVSPAHSMNKRARFDFDEAEPEEPEEPQSSTASPPPKQVNALLAVSNRIKFELEKRRRRDRERAQRPRRRKQLSYFAIVGAFQRAALERNVAVQVECVVEASSE